MVILFYYSVTLRRTFINLFLYILFDIQVFRENKFKTIVSNEICH